MWGVVGGWVREAAELCSVRAVAPDTLPPPSLA